jgi:hypothetical protein
MPEVDLTQAEADALIAAEKHCLATKIMWEFPMFGGKILIPLMSPVNSEDYLLDLNRSQVNLAKISYQNRVRRMIILVRLDLGGSPHRNPDGSDIECPHIHVYREGFADKWAFPLPNTFTDPSDLFRSLEDFMVYCNITIPPQFKKGLF